MVFVLLIFHTVENSRGKNVKDILRLQTASERCLVYLYFTKGYLKTNFARNDIVVVSLLFRMVHTADERRAVWPQMPFIAFRLFAADLYTLLPFPQNRTSPRAKIVYV